MRMLDVGGDCFQRGVAGILCDVVNRDRVVSQADVSGEERLVDGKTNKSQSWGQFTITVFGDWPYNPLLRDSARLLIDSVNADTRVKLVLHVGDIHSGSMPCTGAGLSPLPAGSVPSWNEGIYNLIEQFNDRLVYTPGGHKKKISTQADDFDRRHPGDAQFVENVMWGT